MSLKKSFSKDNKTCTVTFIVSKEKAMITIINPIMALIILYKILLFLKTIIQILPVCS